MSSSQSGDDVVVPLGGKDRLEPKLGHTLLHPARPIAGSVPSPPKNVPVPSVYQEHRS
jgi:hypothetical protein